MANILQSKPWQDFQDSLGKTTIHQSGEGFDFYAVLEKTPVGNYLYLPYGPLLSKKSAFKKSIAAIKKVAREHNCFFIRIEPPIQLEPSALAGFKKSKDLNPAETWVIDLPDTDEEVLKLIPKRMRGYYNTHEKKGITIKSTKNPDDIAHLVNLQKQLAKEKHIGVFSENYLKNELTQPFSNLYLAEYENRIIAAVLCFDDDDTRYYMQAASDSNYRNLAANGIIVTKMLLDAREKGLKFFDFWGIAPEGAPKSHPWAGFTNFKKSFKGREVFYAGTYDLPLNSAKYLFYKIIRKLNRWLRRH